MTNQTAAPKLKEEYGRQAQKHSRFHGVWCVSFNNSKSKFITEKFFIMASHPESHCCRLALSLSVQGVS